MIINIIVVVVANNVNEYSLVLNAGAKGALPGNTIVETHANLIFFRASLALHQFSFPKTVVVNTVHINIISPGFPKYPLHTTCILYLTTT